MNKSDDFDVFGEIIERFNGVHGEPRASVLVIHLFVEYSLDKLLSKLFKNSDKLEKMSFAQKITILDAIGIFSKDLIKDIGIINEVRNLFAHEIKIETDDFESKFLSKMKTISFYNELNMPEPMYAFNIFSMVTVRILNMLKGAYDECVKSKITHI